MIVAHALTGQQADDPSQVSPLLDQIDGEITLVTADGAYAGAPIYQTVSQYGADIDVVIPPPAIAVFSDSGQPTRRDHSLKTIKEHGRLVWQAAVNYGKRALVETAMDRYRALIGTRLRAGGSATQQTEVTIGVAVLNRMTAAGRRNSVRTRPATA